MAIDGRYRVHLLNNRLEVDFQPIVNLQTGKVVKAEILARLRDNAGQVIPPSDFIKEMNNEELYEVFRQGFELGIAARKLWLQSGVDLALSINIPATIVGDPKYVREIARRLQAGDIAPNDLTIEITEADKTDNIDTLYAIINALKSVGVMTAMDDLGAGYSSLIRLERIPFDDVKIDQGLIREVKKTHAMHITYYLTQLAKGLGHTTTVEGLESVDLVEMAAILGASYGQGYAIARPMPASEMVTWYKNYTWNINIADPATELGMLTYMYRASQEVCPRQGVCGGVSTQEVIHATTHLLEDVQSNAVGVIINRKDA